MANITVTLFWDMDLRKWTTTLAGTTETAPQTGIVQGDIVKFAVRFVQGGVAVALTAPVFTASGIKADNDFTGSYLIQLSAPVLSDTTLYTFTVSPLNSANLNTFLQTYRNTWCVLELFDSANGILTTPLELQITPGYSLSGTPTDNAPGVVSVAAGKTVTFPQSLTFPAALGTNGFQLSTDGAGTLTWTAAGGVTDGDKGDITVSASGATWKIDNDVVGLAQLAHMATDRVVGRTTPGNGSPELLTISGTGSVAMTGSPTFTGSALFDSLAASNSISTNTAGAEIATTDINSPIYTASTGSYIETRDTFRLFGGTYTTTLSHAATDNRAIAFPDASGTLVLNDNTATITNKDIVATQLSGNVAVARIATALTTPGAIGGTTPGTVATTTTSLKGATSGVVTLAAPAVATTATLTFAPSASVTMTPPATSFTAARTDAGQTFNGTAVTKNIFAGSGDTVRFDTGVIFTYDTTVANSYATTQFSTTSGNAGSVTVPAFRLWAGGTGTGMYGTGYENISFATASTRRGGWSSAGAFDLTGTLAVSGASTLTGAVTTANFIAGVEMTAPAAPAANGYRIYAEDNGSGKTRLMVLFATGGAQQIAIEP